MPSASWSIRSVISFFLVVSGTRWATAQPTRPADSLVTPSRLQTPRFAVGVRLGALNALETALSASYYPSSASRLQFLTGRIIGPGRFMAAGLYHRRHSLGPARAFHVVYGGGLSMLRLSALNERRSHLYYYPTLGVGVEYVLRSLPLVVGLDGKLLLRALREPHNSGSVHNVGLTLHYAFGQQTPRPIE